MMNTDDSEEYSMRAFYDAGRYSASINCCILLLILIRQFEFSICVFDNRILVLNVYCNFFDFN